MASCATGKGSFLKHHDVGTAQLGQMVGYAASDNAGTNYHYLGMFGKVSMKHV
jgi:hypothetical protein